MRSDADFEVRLVAVAPGGTRAYVEAEWRDALVIVQHGQIELEGLSGSRRSLERGAVLWLAGLPLRALHNRGQESAVIVAFLRAPMSFGPSPSLRWEPNDEESETVDRRADERP
jgi:hypothetical protein